MTSRSVEGVHDSLVELADRFAPQRRSQPVLDLPSLARELGAYDVVYRARTSQGFTEWTAKGPRIVLGWAETEGRRRVLLAHECGHLLLDPVLKEDALALIPEGRRQAMRSRAWLALRSGHEDLLGRYKSVSLEAICDDFAYELVLPDWVAARAAPTITSIDGLSHFRAVLRVSMAVAVLKLNRFKAQHGFPRLGVLHARRAAGDYWMAASATGLPPRWRGRVALTGTSSRSLDQMSVGERRADRVELTNGETTASVAAEIVMHRERATILLNSDDIS